MASIIPELPARPVAETESYTVNLRGRPPATIDADAVIYGVDIDHRAQHGKYYFVDFGSPLVRVTHETVYDWTLINHGLIWNTSDQRTLGVLADLLDNDGTIVAETRKSPESGSSIGEAAVGAYLTGATAGEIVTVLTNTGTIQASATDAIARGVMAFGFGQRFVNNGLIAAESRIDHGDASDLAAFGLLVRSNGHLENGAQGQILAEGSNAYAVQIGGGDRFDTATPAIVNAGRIEARATVAGGDAIGILASVGQDESFSIYNSGVIRGDVAVELRLRDGATSGYSYLLNEAGGLIDGDIVGSDLADNVDTYEGSFLGSATLNGGDDTFYGSAEGNTVDGGAGQDRLYGYAGDDALTGGSGNDSVQGGEGDDTLSGGSDDDYIFGGLGADRISGDDGNDAIYASDGAGNDQAADQIDGGAGDDEISASGGDTVAGGLGRDSLYLDWAAASGAGVARIDLRDLAAGGAASIDGAQVSSIEHLRLVINGQAAHIDARGAPSDFKLEILSYGGDDVILSGGGDDELQSEDGADRINAGAGKDFVQGGTGADVLFGGDGDDTILSGDFFEDQDLVDKDDVRGGAGDDTIWAGYGDRVDGGDGIDILNADYTGATDAVMLTLGQVQHIGGARVAGFESVFLNLGAFDDRIDLSASGEAQVVNAGGGNDRIVGGAGSNDVGGGDGDDRILAGDGYGNLYGAAGDDLLVGGNFADVLQGGDDADRLRGGDGNDQLYGDDGDDVLDGGTGADVMEGGDGADVFIVDNARDQVVETGLNETDTVIASVNFDLTRTYSVENLELRGAAHIGSGNARDNRIDGAGRSDTLSGLDGDDRLDGKIGNDKIDGGEGNDTLIGGAGRDALTGGGGADAFRFAAGDSGSTRATADKIADFGQVDGDKIDLSSIDAVSGTSAVEAFRFIGTAGFSGIAGELRYHASHGDTLVMGDTDGDGVADLVITVTGNIALVASDFGKVRVSSFVTDADAAPAHAPTSATIGGHILAGAEIVSDHFVMQV